MSFGDPWLHVTIVAIGIVVAVGIVVLGAVVLVRRALVLKKRLAGYGALPVIAVASKTGVMVGAANVRASQIPELQARVDRARYQLEAARLSIVRDIFNFDNLARLIGAIVFG